MRNVGIRRLLDENRSENMFFRQGYTKAIGDVYGRISYGATTRLETIARKEL
jgi:hypothetical protein